MKLLFVYQYCSLGGVEIVLRNRLKTLIKEGIAFDILFLSDSGGKKIFSEFLDSLHVTSDYNEIIDLIEKEKYDCIINIDTPQIFEALYNVSYHPRIILEIHTTYENNLAYLHEISKINPLAIITPSNYMVSVIKQKTNKDIPIHVIPNSIDDKFLHNENLDSTLNLKKKLIGWAGRLDYIKNWSDIIYIYKRLNSFDKNCELWILGGAMAPESIRKDFFIKLKSNNILPNVRWFPKIEYRFMPNFYKLISKSGGCFISTSINESFGMTVLESMASKCPVVAPDVGGLPELLDNGSCGILYPSGNIEQAALSINKVTTDIKLRETLISKAYENVLSNYISEKIVNKWINLIKEYVH